MGKNVFLSNENWREHINRQSATQANWKLTLTSYAGHFTQMTNEASLPTLQRQQSELCSMLREAQREKEQQSNPFFFSQDPEQCSRAGGGGRGRGAALLTARDPAVFHSKCAFLSTSLVPAMPNAASQAHDITGTPQCGHATEGLPVVRDGQKTHTRFLSLKGSHRNSAVPPRQSGRQTGSL